MQLDKNLKIKDRPFFELIPGLWAREKGGQEVEWVLRTTKHSQGKKENKAME